MPGDTAHATPLPDPGLPLRSELGRLLSNRWQMLKRLIEFVAYCVYDGFHLRRGTPVAAPASTVAVLQLSLLGDYFLWRSYGLALVAHLRSRPARTVLICNALYAELAAHDFPDCEILALDTQRWVRDARYRRHHLQQFRRLNAEHCYYPGFPRNGLVGDGVVRALGAPATGFAEAARERHWLDAALSNRLYVRLVPTESKLHQTERHRQFLHAIGARPPLSITASKPRSAAATGSRYYVLAPGASRPERRWPLERFIEVGRRLQVARPSWQCLILGSGQERAIGEAIALALGAGARNLTGQTDPAAMEAWIAGAELVVGNDSAAPHAAVAHAVSSLVITGGGHFGMFFPYPESSASPPRSHVAVAHPMPCFNCDWNCRYQHKPGAAYPCVDAITVDRAWQGMQSLLEALPNPDPRGTGT